MGTPAVITPHTMDQVASSVSALTRLLDVAVELGSTDDLDRILQIATVGVCQAVGCERATLFLYDEQRQELYTRVVTELEIDEIRHPIQQGIAGWVARHGELQNISDPAADPRWDRSVDLRTGFQTRNILAAPVISAGEQRVLGVLQLLNKPSGFHAIDEQVIRGFAAHVALAIERKRLREKAQAAEELRQSLEMGRRIQLSFLPKHLPDLAGYEVAAWWEPAEFVSGDYYDWIKLPDGRWAFLVGDVSGHGLPAALLMAAVRAMARVLAQAESSPSRFLELLRQSITPDLNHSRFITFLLLTLHLETHVVTVANAGHAPAYVYSAHTDEFQRLAPTVTPFGFPAVELPQTTSSLILQPGDMLILGTDGVVELRDVQDQMFGTERLLNLIREHARLPLTDLMQRVSTTLRAFHGRPLPMDDTTLVMVRRAGSSALPTRGSLWRSASG